MAEQLAAELEEIRAQDFVRTAYGIYGKYVIEDRAVADHRDGLKPVQRRILWSMFKNGLKPGTRFQKCALTVGDVLGKYHPHGDGGTYGALVGLAWKRYEMIDKQGNFGSVTAPPAAYRYTEARLAEIAMKYFECIDVGEFVKNFSGDYDEPLVLPSRAPFMLLNGSEGIAVGISAAIPPHNLTEVVEGFKYLIKKGEGATLDGVLKHIKGPDYGTGVLVSSPDEVRTVYDQGWGVLRYRCKFHVEEQEDHKQLVITSYAPRFNVLKFMRRCDALREEGLIEYIDNKTSMANGTKLIVGFTNPAVMNNRVIPWLYTHVNYQFYVTERERTKDEAELPAPKFMPLLPMMQAWLEYRREVETAMVNLEVKRLEEVLWKQETILVAIQNLDTIKQAMDKAADEMAPFLVKKLKITVEQANLILDTTIRHLAKVNLKDQQAKIKATTDELDEWKATIEDIDNKVIIPELNKLLKFADDRGMDVGAESVDEVGSGIGDVSDDLMTVVAGNTGGHILKMGESPIVKGKGFPWDFLVKTGQQFTIAEKAGMAYTATMSYVKDGDSECRGVVGLIPNTKDKIIAVAEDGTGVVLEHPVQKSEYRLMKTDTEIRSVVGINEDDKLIVWNDRTYHEYSWKDLNPQRPNTKGWLILPRQTDKVNLTVVGPGHKLVNTSGEELDMDDFMKVDDFFVVGNTNFVIFDGGTKVLADQKEAIGYIANGGVTSVFVLE